MPARNLLDSNRIQSQLNFKHDYELIILDKVKSTQSYLQAYTTQKHYCFCLAHSQSHGQGQRAQPWHSPPGQNIYLSFKALSSKPPNQLQGISQAIALAVLDALKQWLPTKHWQLKWPNDIFYDSKKIAGILIETRPAPHGHEVIIGIGANINMTQAHQADIDQLWTSLKRQTKENYDLNEVAANIMNHCVSAFETFNGYGLAPFLDRWHRYDCLLNQQITVQQGRNSLSGIAQGINSVGALQLQQKPATPAISISTGSVLTAIADL